MQRPHPDPAPVFRRYAAERRSEDRDELVRRFLPMARKLALRYARGSEPLEDLEQVAALGLLKAVDRYDPGRGFAFTSFAVPTILGELRRHFRNFAWTAHVPRAVQERVMAVRRATDELTRAGERKPTVGRLAEHLGNTEEEVVEALGAAASTDRVPLDASAAGHDGEMLTLAERLGRDEAGYELVEDRGTVASVLHVLTQREREVLTLRFFGGLSQTEIAERIGVSQMQVSRVLRAALARLSIVAEHQSRPRRAA
ncbi:MAG: polymerase, sigma 28 subunit, Sig subfamily [Solirubrobacterales bacterium]|nr:polymerase, sigma 28 subunit, Sig subfamily [Solirubrobacterales bacterium]